MAEVNKDPGKTIAPTNLADVVVGTVGKITPADALGALTQLVTAARESIQIHETEATKREQLRGYSRDGGQANQGFREGASKVLRPSV